MSAITPCFWYDDKALEAAEFYTGLFPDSEIQCVSRYLEGDRMPAGLPLTVRFTLCGQEFLTLNGGPEFALNPAISLSVSCPDVAEAERLWAALSEGGGVLMPLGEYPFSQRYGWCCDRYGLSWQVNMDGRSLGVTPCLMFCGAHYGKARQALEAYRALLPDSEIESLALYAEGQGEPVGTVMQAVCTLAGRRMQAMDSAMPHQFTFNEAASLCVYCQTQEDIDRVWAALTADGGEESVCGWLRDRFGLWWQIIYEGFDRMLDGSDPQRAKRVTEVVYGMRKPDLRALRDAYEGCAKG